MKIQLLISQWCPTCPAAEALWSKAAAQEGMQLEVLDVAETAGRRVVVEAGARTVPALIIDGTLRAVGSSSISQARALLKEALGRQE